MVLSDFDLNHGGKYEAYDNAYYNVSEVANYAVAQLDWTTGRLPDEHHRLMYELCHILGADQYVPTRNNTQLAGISQAFFRVYLYWGDESNNQPTSIVPNTELEWAPANAMQLYQNLVNWHNQHPRLCANYVIPRILFLLPALDL
jgi:hypothetical protein